MTEITRVPLQPIAKGSLTKIWLGVAVLALAAGGVAWAVMPKMVDVEVLSAGDGPAPAASDVPFVNYKGMLADGKVFDEGKEFPAVPGRTVPGFTKALLQMQPGGKYRVTIPAELAYGMEGVRDPNDGKVIIPANADLTFEIEMLGAMPPEQFQQYQMMQQAQMRQLQQQMQGGGRPQGEPTP